MIKQSDITKRDKRIEELEAVIAEIAKQHLCDELSDEQSVDMGDIEYGYDQLIVIARKVIKRGE